MSRRGVRVFLFLVAIAAVATAAFFVVSLDRAAQIRQDTHRKISESGHRGTRLVAAAPSGMQAYVSPGQSEAWWRERVRADLDALGSVLAGLREQTSDPSALNDLDAAADALSSLGRVEDRAFSLVRDDERTRASVLIFKEGLEVSDTIRERLLSALFFVDRAMRAAQMEDRSRQAAAAGGAAALALLVAGLLLPRRVAPAPTAAPAPVLRDVEVPATPIAVPELAPAVVAPAASVAPVVAEPAAPPAELQPGRDRRKSLELRAAADLCTDFARLLNSQELPALLERAGRLIDASGIIIWMADPSGQELRPTLAFGYPAQTITRLPAIPRAGDNATAAAYRRAELEVVQTNGMSPGAIVAPLLTAQGCVGVMAAEVRHGREASEGARSLARIVAAQLSTLLGVPAVQDASAPADAPVATTG
jgi:hypothetical protein